MPQMPQLGDIMLGVSRSVLGAAPGVFGPDTRGETDSIDAVLKEVEAGLPNEYSSRIDDAQKNQDFYDGDMIKHLRFKEAEIQWDHDNRRKRTRLLTRRIVDVLCEHLYNPGPQRRLESSKLADAWLGEQYTRNHIDAVMQEADRLSTLNDVAAIKVVPSGNENGQPGPSGLNAPVRLQLYGAEEFAVWCHPDDPTTPWVVCTIDKFNEQKRMQVWTDQHVWTFTSKPLAKNQTAGGRVMQFRPELSFDNPYGTLPFAFVHYSLPVRSFWTEGPGTAIREANDQVNQESTDLSTAVQYYGNPMTLVFNAESGWRPVVRPGGIIAVPPNKQHTMGEGEGPRVESLQHNLDIAGIQGDLDAFISGILEDHGIPRSMVRLDQSAAASGAAIIAEQLPLLTRAMRRRRSFGVYECGLARVCLLVAGNYYGVQELVDAAADPQLQLTWPRIEIPVPGQEQDNSDLFELDEGFSSELGVMMRRHGLSREQAMAELKQVAKDKAWYAKLKQKYGVQPGEGEAPAVPGGGAAAAAPDAGEQDTSGAGNPTEGNGSDQGVSRDENQVAGAADGTGD